RRTVEQRLTLGCWASPFLGPPGGELRRPSNPNRNALREFRQRYRHAFLMERVRIEDLPAKPHSSLYRKKPMTTVPHLLAIGRNSRAPMQAPSLLPSHDLIRIAHCSLGSLRAKAAAPCLSWRQPRWAHSRPARSQAALPTCTHD